MTVDFAFKKAPKMKVATVSWKGPWSDKKIHSHFDQVARWAKTHKVKTGAWVFREPASRRWEVGIEVRGSVKASGPIRLRTLPKATVASVVYDPEVVSPRVIYHGLTDWLKWRKKEHEIKRVVSYREIYQGDPWRNKAAWAKTEVQFVVKK